MTRTPTGMPSRNSWNCYGPRLADFRRPPAISATVDRPVNLRPGGLADTSMLTTTFVTVGICMDIAVADC